jgi:hypothetical protein
MSSSLRSLRNSWAVGAGICGAAHAQAGVQRLDHALHQSGWQAHLIQDVLWEEADTHLAQMQALGDTRVLMHESRVIEKAESEQSVGTSAVRSSRGRRLARTRTRLFTRVEMPIRVPGLEWEQMLLVGRQGMPVLGEMHWWERHKGGAGHHHRVHEAMVTRAARRWGRSRVRCVVRWKKGTTLLDATGQERKAWEIARGTRSWGESTLLWDTQTLVRHAESPGDLFLGVVRQGKGREPWSLLTTEPVETAEQAWEIVCASATRWTIEEPFRCDNGEWRIDTFRLQDGESQRTVLMLVTVAASFLLSPLSPALHPARPRGASLVPTLGLAAGESPTAPLSASLGSLQSVAGPPPRLAGCHPSRAPTHITLACGFTPMVDDPLEPRRSLCRTFALNV